MEFETYQEDRRDVAELLQYKPEQHPGLDHFRNFFASISHDPARASEACSKLLEGLGRRYGLYSLAFDEAVYAFVTQLLKIAGDPDSMFLPVAQAAYPGRKLSPTSNIFRNIAQCFAFVVGGELSIPDHRLLHEAFCVGITHFFRAQIPAGSAEFTDELNWKYDEQTRLWRQKVRDLYHAEKDFDNVEEIIETVGAAVELELTANEEFRTIATFINRWPELAAALKGKKVLVDGEKIQPYKFIQVHAPSGDALEDKHIRAAIRAAVLALHLGMSKMEAIGLLQKGATRAREAHNEHFRH